MMGARSTHYGMRPSSNDLGVSHENGSIESRQNSLKLTHQRYPGHRYLRRHLVREVREAQTARRMRFREEHHTFGAVAGAPVAHTALQGTQQRVVVCRG